MSTVAEPARVECPDCLRDDTMPSMPQGRIEKFLFSAFLVYRFRCRACLNRFPLRKVGRAYLPLVRSANKLVWGVSISVIAVSLVLISAMAVKARNSRRVSHIDTAAPPQAQPEGFKFSVVDDVSPEKKAHAQFMNNFTAPPDPKAQKPDAVVPTATKPK